MNKVVTVMGEAGAGKDSFFKSAERLASRRGLTLINEKFAKPIHEAAKALTTEYLGYESKETIVEVDVNRPEFRYWCDAVAAALGRSWEDIYHSIRSCFKTHLVASHDLPGVFQGKLRLVMELIGTEAMRDVFGEDVWVNLLKTRLTHYDSPTTGVLITDTRFPNELHVADGGVVLVLRNDRPNLGPREEQSHSSRQLVYDLTRLGWEYKLYGSESALNELKTRIRDLGSHLLMIVESYKKFRLGPDVYFNAVYGAYNEYLQD